MVADSFPSLTYRRRYLPLPARGTINPRIRRLLIAAGIVMVPVMLLYPSAQQIINVIDEDFIVVDIMKHHVDKLKFTVAGHDYEVRTPNISLTDRQQEAWFSYAARHKLPVYAADGPFALDP